MFHACVNDALVKKDNASAFPHPAPRPLSTGGAFAITGAKISDNPSGLSI
jgi:hypothetical protein